MLINSAQQFPHQTVLSIMIESKPRCYKTLKRDFGAQGMHRIGCSLDHVGGGVE